MFVELRRPSQRRVAAAVVLSEAVAVGHTLLAWADQTSRSVEEPSRSPRGAF